MPRVGDCLCAARHTYVASAVANAVCGFSATLTRDLYICFRNGSTESVPKQTMIWALTHGFPRRSFITELAGRTAVLPAFFLRNTSSRWARTIAKGIQL